MMIDTCLICMQYADYLTLIDIPDDEHAYLVTDCVVSYDPCDLTQLFAVLSMYTMLILYILCSCYITHHQHASTVI